MAIPDDFWTAIATGGLALVQAVIVALIALRRRASQRGEPEVAVPVRPSAEFSDVVTRIEKSVGELIRGGSELAGQVKLMQETMRTQGQLAERVAVVEREVKRAEELREDTNREVHEIKHTVRNLTQKVDALGAKALGKEDDWRRFVETGRTRGET